jgi:hypothetical protein
MTLWIEFIRCAKSLRPACSRYRTFLWLLLVLAALAIRPDLLGVTSLVRASFLDACCYPLLLNFFHSKALPIDRLRDAWIRLALQLFKPVTIDGYLLFAADGLKVPKEGKKMPAVKSLHQESANNSKPTFIMGHSFQAVSLLVSSINNQVLAVPLASVIVEGLRWANLRYRRSILDKLAALFLQIVRASGLPAILVADAYYSSRTIINPLLLQNCHLVTKVKKTSTAYKPAPPPPDDKKPRGRPKKYGDKVRLWQLFKAWHTFQKALSPVYGEENVTIQYRSVDLLWKPVGRMVRFVLVKHPSRGNIILLSSSLTFDPLTIIKVYGLRFKIEVSFKQALHTIGAYGYHFWMMDMIPIKKGSGDQDIEGMPWKYQLSVQRKMDAYHRYVQIGCIVQGLLQHLAVNFREEVWAAFKGWLRTMRPDLNPSEMVAAEALKTAFPEFLLGKSGEPEITKFILDRACYERIPGFTMTG